MKQRPCTRVTGPLAPYAPGFRTDLASRGYAPASVRNRLWQLNHLSRWLDREGLKPAELTPERVEQFLDQRRAEGYKTWLSMQGMALPLAYLRTIGVVPTPAAHADQSHIERVVEAYRDYLVDEQGLADATVKHYVHVARLFLSAQSTADKAVELDCLKAAEVTGFVGRECAARSVSSAKHMIASLRSLLRYLHVAGLTATPLTSAVPGVASRRATSLPQGLDATTQAAALLCSCDRRRTVGRRDYAILTLLARLGLRAGEVAGLELDDVDWRRGEIVIRGKGNRHERLPVPHDVGEALVDYLRHGRPVGPQGCRALFLRVRAPRVGLVSSGVSAVVRDACGRAGLPRVGAHRLRHTAATEMLRHGASLPEVAQVLRHRRLDTTAIYAKVDRVALRALAQPWPGGGA